MTRFDYIDQASYVVPTLTTIRVPVRETREELACYISDTWTRAPCQSRRHWTQLAVVLLATGRTL